MGLRSGGTKTPLQQSRAAGEHLLTIEATEPIKVASDGDRLRQVLVNPVDNTTKYIPHSGSISVTSTGAIAALRVRDYGRGMTPEALMRALERFCRSDQARPRPGSISLENARSASEMVVTKDALEAVPGTSLGYPDTETAFVVCAPGATGRERLLRALADAGLQPSAA